MLLFPPGIGSHPTPTFGLAGAPTGSIVVAGFNQAGIDVATTWSPATGEVVLSWTSPAPAGTYFQLYVDNALTWSGTQRSVSLPWPSGPFLARVGTVGPGQSATDFSATFTPPTGYDDRAALAWTLAAPTGDAVAFDVYRSPAPGVTVDYSRPIASIPAYAGGVGTPSGPASYSWTSGPLTSGIWTFGVKARDAAGNDGATREVAVAIVAAPGPPGANTQAKRLTYTYIPPTRTATLHWLAPTS